MNKQTLKKAMIITNIAVSLLFIFMTALETILLHLHIGLFYYVHIILFGGVAAYIVYLYCAAGIILLVRFLIKNKTAFSRKYFLLIPSLILSIFLVFLRIFLLINHVYSLETIITEILLALGMPALLAYYLSGDYKLYLSAILCFIFPLSIFISGIL